MSLCLHFLIYIFFYIWLKQKWRVFNFHKKPHRNKNAQGGTEAVFWIEWHVTYPKIQDYRALCRVHLSLLCQV